MPSYYEPAGPERRGHATWIRRRQSAQETALLVEAPASRWETGTFRAAMQLFNGYPAAGLLLSGASPTADAYGRSDMRRASGRRSYYHVIHEAWVDHDDPAVVVHGIAAIRDPGRDVVLSIGQEVSGIGGLPAWAGDVARVFGAGGLDVTAFDGSLSLASFEGSFDPALAYATRFAPGSTLLLWLAPGLRAQLIRIQEDRATEARLARAKLVPEHGSIVALAADWLGCDVAGRCANSVVKGDALVPAVGMAGCHIERVAGDLEAYTRRRHPLLLTGALAAARACRWAVRRDPATGLIWAALSDGQRMRLVPLLGGPVRRIAAPVPVGRPLELATAGGLVSLEVVRP